MAAVTLVATVHKCSGCGKASWSNRAIVSHIATKCPQATMLSGKLLLRSDGDACVGKHVDKSPQPGYVYYVTTPHMPHIAKFGRWTGTLSTLRSRYATYYADANIIATATDSPRMTEAALKKAMRAEGVLLRNRELVRDKPAARRAFWRVADG
jgi:hypothetical protein